MFERYMELSNDVKYQIGFIDDWYVFDFDHLKDKTY
jgi:hypothetical protein